MWRPLQVILNHALYGSQGTTVTRYVSKGFGCHSAGAGQRTSNHLIYNHFFILSSSHFTFFNISCSAFVKLSCNFLNWSVLRLPFSGKPWFSTQSFMHSQLFEPCCFTIWFRKTRTRGVRHTERWPLLPQVLRLLLIVQCSSANYSLETDISVNLRDKRKHLPL